MGRGSKRKQEDLPRTNPSTLLVTHVVAHESPRRTDGATALKQTELSDVTNSPNESNEWCSSTNTNFPIEKRLFITPLSVPSGAHTNSQIMPSVIDCNEYNEYNPPPDMSGKITEGGIAVVLKQCVKNLLFRDVKFFSYRDHDQYCTDPSTLCGKILIHCHSQNTILDKEWWDDHKGIVIKAITNMRNNSIKRIKELFQGMSYIIDTYLSFYSSCKHKSNAARSFLHFVRGTIHDRIR